MGLTVIFAAKSLISDSFGKLAMTKKNRFFSPLEVIGVRLTGLVDARFVPELTVAGKFVAAVELAKEWRTDRMLRRLEAMLAVADENHSLIITGNGDVLEPEQGLVAIGSGGAYAHSAAKALLENTELLPEEIVKKSLTIAGELCIYTNQHHTIEVLGAPEASGSKG